MPSVAKGSPEPERGGERFVAKGVARVLDELASPLVAKRSPGRRPLARSQGRLMCRCGGTVNDVNGRAF
jgi:hypothetical protein